MSAASEPERIEKAGRSGWRWSDGAILWDDGEKEVPTSGLSDEQKRAEARRAAGDSPELTRKGVSPAEISAAEADLAVLGDPDRLLATRKAAAKAHAGKKPENERDLPPTDVELQQNARISVKRLLEREISRLEELKDAAIAGQLELGRGGVPVSGGNPPMRLHEAILTFLRVSDEGTPLAMMKALREAVAWQALSPGQIAATTLPQPPSGVPLKPAVVPPVPDLGQTPQASHDRQGGGQPTEYPPVTNS